MTRPGGSRPSSVAGRLARLGFADPTRAEGDLRGPVLAAVIGPGPDVFDEDLVVDLGRTADPDLALIGLVRLLEGWNGLGDVAAAAPADPGPVGPGGADLLELVRSGGPARSRLLAVLGSSAALGDHLARHPQSWATLTEQRPTSAEDLRADLLRSVDADPAADQPVAGRGGDWAYDRLRVAYRRRLLSVAGRDLSAEDAREALPAVAGELADLAAAALECGLAIARAEMAPESTPCRLAVIGMGKCGGRELNYVSDVDVIFVAEPGAGVRGEGADGSAGPGGHAGDERDRDALRTAHQLATGLIRACSLSTAEGTLWPVDANLRPEGGRGPLVRTLASHLAYYQRWAKTWEFQALLKARPVAGDRSLGAAYLAAVTPLVWQAAERENFVPDVQAMRRRVEEQVPADQAERQLKLGRGGLRDVEFCVQLLQLVHGRVDETVRGPSTLTALAALAAGGYVGRDDAASLDRAYRLLRALEHRLQLFRLRRTHLMPTGESDLRRLGRQLGHRVDPAQGLQREWQARAREVRRLHERLFYRPLLGAVAQLSTDEVRLTTSAATSRLLALGYRNPGGALRHLESLTEGVSRRAAIQRQLLPVMLGWFADEADPDAGLLAFRRISDALGRTHWYLKMLRDDGSAAERLAHLLARSQFAGDLLAGAPESARLLGDDRSSRPLPVDQLRTEVLAAVSRYDDPERAMAAARGLRRRELFRIATADLLGGLELDDVERALTDVTSALLEGALVLARRTVEERRGDPLPTRLAVVAMGRFGGGELGYGSDADVLFVHDPLPGADEPAAQEAALAVVGELRRLVAAPGPGPALDLDADLRPEGRNGPLVRSLDSYAAYYRRWSLIWEAQALLRATPVAGDQDLANRFRALIDQVRWPAAGLTEVEVREVRRIKARVEAERLPRGADPAGHLKLGRGGLADVEWTIQLLQLRHAHQVPGLRHTGTVTALRAAGEAGLIAVHDARVLGQMWSLASRLRNAAVLWRGRPVDALPSDLRDLDGVARIIGYRPGTSHRLTEDYARSARRARGVVERIFYG
jgi:[glutamine synthetase] adenylyltransferase / [glutamine synthetase]-adenylyl-L-tyrosine phosphorylase